MMRARYLVALLSLAPFATAQSSIDGHWRGAIEIPGQSLEFHLDIEAGEDALSMKISIPVQGMHDVALVDVTRDGKSLTFRIPDVPGRPTFQGEIGETAISGDFTQGAAKFPWSAARHAAGAVAQKALEGFQDFLAMAVTDADVPSAAIAVVAGGEVVFAGAAGYRDREKKLPATADTLYAIGSSSKAFTTTVLGTFVDEGKVDWDARVREYVPRFRMHDTAAAELMTVRDLVTHRSGMPRHDAVWYNNNEISRAEIVSRLAHLESTATLRARFQYNNLMYIAAGHLLEEVSGDTWEELVRTRLFQPLAMKRSTLSVLDSQRDADHALPYGRKKGELERIPFRRIDVAGPAGSINSSVREMTAWLRLNLQGGKVDEARLIEASTIRELHRPQMAMGNESTRPDVSSSSYALGWMVDTYRGHRRIHHGGAIDGFISMVMLFPDDGVGMCAFTNVGSGLPNALCQHAADRVLGLEPVEWLEELVAARERAKKAEKDTDEESKETRVEGTRFSHPIADYVGRYEHPGYGHAEVRVGNSSLELSYNGMTGVFEHWHYDVFRGADTNDDAPFEGAKVMFRSDFDGHIVEAVITLEPAVDPIVFRKSADAKLSDPEYLAKLPGEYSLGEMAATVELVGKQLYVTVPGQPRYTLEPAANGRFQFKELKGYALAFVLNDDGDVEKAVFHQPDGVHEATRKKD